MENHSANSIKSALTDSVNSMNIAAKRDNDHRYRRAFTGDARRLTHALDRFNSLMESYNGLLVAVEAAKTLFYNAPVTDINARSVKGAAVKKMIADALIKSKEINQRGD